MHYEQLREEVIKNHQQLNPIDQVVNYADLEYQFDSEGGVPYLLNKKTKRELNVSQWAHRQMCEKLGVPNQYIQKCPPNLKEQNINYFLTHVEGEFKLRLVNENTVRAVLTPSYTPIDDFELMDLIAPFMTGHQIDVVSHYNSDLMTSIRAVFGSVDKTSAQVGDIVKKGIVINNSEVGYMAVQFRAFLYRLVCTNGMIAPKEMGGFHFRHRGNKERIYKHSDVAMDLLDKNLDVYSAKFDKSREIQLLNPPEVIKEAVEEENWPKKWEETFVNAYNIEPSETLFGLINAYTRGAQKLALHDRVEVEEYATNLLGSVN